MSKLSHQVDSDSSRKNVYVQVCSIYFLNTRLRTHVVFIKIQLHPHGFTSLQQRFEDHRESIQEYRYVAVARNRRKRERKRDKVSYFTPPSRDCWEPRDQPGEPAASAENLNPSQPGKKRRDTRLSARATRKPRRG